MLGTRQFVRGTSLFTKGLLLPAHCVKFATKADAAKIIVAL